MKIRKAANATKRLQARVNSASKAKGMDSVDGLPTYADRAMARRKGRPLPGSRNHKKG